MFVFGLPKPLTIQTILPKQPGHILLLTEFTPGANPNCFTQFWNQNFDSTFIHPTDDAVIIFNN